MDFGHFISLCGGSIFPEEYRGDLDAAWEYLQQVRQSAAAQDLNVRAEYLRCLAIYSILIGRFANAFESLDILHGLLDQLPPEWGLRYTNYKVLADYTRRFPPSVRFYHERGKAMNTVMLSDIVGPNEFWERFMRGFQQYFARGALRDQGLCQVLGAVQIHPTHVRNLTSWFHPLSCSASYHRPEQDPAPKIAECAKFLLQYRDLADANGFTRIAIYLSRLVGELHLACQSPESSTVLGDLYQRCERASDLAGMADCKMMKGDNLVSPAFSSPLSLNLVIADVTSSIGEDVVWDPIEFGLKVDYPPQARQCYESALELFQAAGCKRGQAAVLLRQACCLHNEARHQRRKDESYLDSLAESESKLLESENLFGRDEASVQLVLVHQILLSISRGTSHKVKAIAREIGEWGVKARNELLVHFLGLLLSRFAYQEWSKFFSMDKALLAWECAYELLKPIGDEIPVFQTVVSRAWVQEEMFNAAASKLLIEEAISMVDRLSEYYDTKIQSAPDTVFGQADKTTLQTSKFNTLWSFARRVISIYMRLEDLQAFEAWQKKLAHWIEHDESFKHFRDKLQQSDSFGTGSLAYSKEKLRGLWRKVLTDDAIRVRYASTEIRYRRLLEEGDVLQAEAALRRFVDEAKTLERIYARDLYRILACERIGDTVKAREILDSIDDNRLFQENLEDYLQGISLGENFSIVAENALRFLVFGEDQGRARRVLELIMKIAPDFFEVQGSAVDLSFRLSQHGAIMRELQPEKSFSKLLQARQIVESRRVQTTDLDARIGASTSSWTTEIFLNLARICLSCSAQGVPLSVIQKYDHGHPTDISWTEHALLFVEMSRARAVLDSLQEEANQLQRASGNKNSTPLSEPVHKKRLLRSLLCLETLTPEQEKEALELCEDIRVLEENGALSSATTFIETANFPTEPELLYQSIDEDAVVIEATFGPRGYLAFAVTREGIQHVTQGSTRYPDIRRLVMQAMKILREMTGYIGEEEEDRKKELTVLSSEISALLLVPFAKTVRTKSHVIFSLSDPLTAFPFSILTLDGKPLVMHAAVSQVPSLTVLHYLSQRKPASGMPTVSVLAKSLVEQSASPEKPPKEVNLHMAGIEAVIIARTFGTWPVEASRLSRNDFRKYIEDGSLVMHIGTHGVINPRNPLLSSISIGDGQDFRVADMSTIRSRVNLLVFAACLSGLGKATISSEVLGFSHVVLSSGCQAYIGSLWEVSDFGTMLIMTFFYRHLKNQPSLGVAETMRQAQLELLQLKCEKVNTLLDDMMEGWGASNEGGQSPAEFVPDADFLFLTVRMILDQLDWSSPFYWAPFTLMGYGGFRFVDDKV